MKAHITIISILLAFTINLPAAQSETIVQLETKTGVLEGSLLVPKKSSRIPVALIISGSGPTDRDGNNPMMNNNSLKMLATELYENGIATLRYDKRGVGKSNKAGLKEKLLRFEHYIEDAKGWVQFLKHRKEFDEIVVIGHSEGSLIGMIVSQQEDVDKFISIAGIGQSANKTIIEQLKAQPSVVLEQAMPIINKLAQGQTVKNVPPMLSSLFRPSIQPYMISWFNYDPQEEIAKLKNPVLIIQGSTDIQVSIKDAEKLYKANQGSVKVIIRGMNHILKEAELDRHKNIQTYNQPDLPIKKELIDSIVDFIR